MIAGKLGRRLSKARVMANEELKMKFNKQ